MFDTDVLVIGGGPAGIAAALAISAAGLAVELCEQRPQLGGAIYRRPIEGARHVALPALLAGRWRRLAERLAAAKVSIRTTCAFLGIDSSGLALIENRQERRVDRWRVKAVILACGAIERVLPRPGWQLAGVSTVGGLQVMMKETGNPPAGRVLLAGSGPLLLAAAAQMSALGNPPVAIVEAGNPSALAGESLRLLKHPRLLSEATAYLLSLRRQRLPWRRATSLMAIERSEDALVATLETQNGQIERLVVDRIGLHDGLRPNDFGLQGDEMTETEAPIVIKAGDCREVLGAIAAEADGYRAGTKAASLLRKKAMETSRYDKAVRRERNAQASIAKLFRPTDGAAALTRLPDEVVLCRCEGRTVGQLRAMVDSVDPMSAREIKLNGRFSMGACQGRFCAEWTLELIAALRSERSPPAIAELTGRRWPIRPVSLQALAAASQASSRDDSGGPAALTHCEQGDER